MGTLCDLPIAKLTLDPDLHVRRALDPRTVNRYAAAMRAGDAFPPVPVYFDGTIHWTAGGRHRIAARQKNGKESVGVELFPGGRREALLHAVKTDAYRALRMTSADKERAVLLMLAVEEFREWSDRKIAAQCGVSHPFVAKLRNAHYPSSTQQKRRGADGLHRRLRRRQQTKHPPAPRPVASSATTRGDSAANVSDVAVANAAAARGRLSGPHAAPTAEAPAPPAVPMSISLSPDTAKRAAAVDRIMTAIFGARSNANASVGAHDDDALLARAAACHEAGHALMALLQRRDLPALDLDGDSFPTPTIKVPTKPRSDDPVAFDEGVNSSDLVARARIETEALFWIAGVCAALESMPPDVRARREHETWEDDDYRYVESVIMDLEGSHESRRDYLHYLQARTSDMLRKHWAAVEAVADTLLRRRTLSSAEVEDLLRPAEAGVAVKPTPRDRPAGR